MNKEVKVPQLPESIADATVVNWHKQPGESVQRDENLVDLETDKVVLEVPAPVAGILREIRKADGVTVTSGELLAIIEEGAVSIDEEKSAPDEASTPATPPKVEKSAHKLSPSVRRLLEEHGIDPGEVTGSGRDGRISKSDVMKFVKSNRTAADEAPAAVSASSALVGSRQDRRVPMTRLRSRIADRMVEAQHTAAMLTSFNEVDLSAVMDLRRKYKERFEKKYGSRLGFMSFFAKASVEALKKFPSVNATIEESDIIYHDYYDIGVAVSTDRGLMVPILRDVNFMSFADIEKTIADFAGRARDGNITLEDLTGGTFTITNGGVFGSLMSTPILNMPQSAILGMHAIKERPVVVDGEIVVRPMMYIALTYDHRIIDGREAVQFLVSIKETLEDPARMMLQI
ncbi:MAG: 2-oxoglutarate dehydrogenase complex dihydrolipoyllysine-residue succinyltransferase [Gammaproteobacteria bacterium]|nr:2-oxoglutarate dehydrogenase complex dihydrolipoyllysine-residue succinyltransferase [Gammaproteobacteria bacterium]